MDSLTQKEFEATELGKNMAAARKWLALGRAGRARDQIRAKAAESTVSMAEFRCHFCDAIPGLLPATAKSLGVTPPELLELIRCGKLTWGDVTAEVESG